jgi:dipeptidyl aminopeptidase/acylaminoacyl peptidase
VLPKPTFPVPSLDAYVFTNPSVVLTHSAQLGLAGWLPDSEQVLITQAISGTSTDGIAAANLRTGEMRQCGQRQRLAGKPAWMGAPDKVAFVDMIGQQRDLWITACGAAVAHTAVLRKVTDAFAAGSDSVIVVLSQGGRAVAVDAATGANALLPIDLAEQGFAPERSLTYFGMAWHSTTSHLAIFDTEHLVLADTRGGKPKLIDLGQKPGYGPLWAWDVQWSPDGRYLAIVATALRPILPFTELLVLDTQGGKLIRANLPAGYAVSPSWSPNSRHFAALALLETTGGVNMYGIFLVDAVTGQSRRALPAYQTPRSLWGLAWSPDGGTLALECPTASEGRLCLSKVSVKP